MDIDGVEVLKHYMWGYLKTVFFSCSGLEVSTLYLFVRGIFVGPDKL